MPPTTVSPSKLAYLRDLNCRALGSNRDHSKEAVCITVRARCKGELVVRTVVREGIMAKTAVPTYCPPAAEPQTFDMPVFQRWLIELRDARSKPSSAGRYTDKEHGAAAFGRWRRHQHIVNPEVAIGRQ